MDTDQREISTIDTKQSFKLHVWPEGQQLEKCYGLCKDQFGGLKRFFHVALLRLPFWNKLTLMITIVLGYFLLLDTKQSFKLHAWSEG